MLTWSSFNSEVLQSLWYSIFFLCQQISFAAQNQQWMPPTDKYCVCIKAWYIFFLCAIQLHCCPKTIKKKHQWATLLQWVTCSSITKNTHIVVYFHSIPHTHHPCCHKYSLEHRMWINPPPKVVPNTCNRTFRKLLETMCERRTNGLKLNATDRADKCETTQRHIAFDFT